MANPVTSIVNPTGESVLRFWVTAKQQLALSQTPIDDKHGEQTLKYRANGTPAGNHAPNQCIAAVYLRGMPSVFGKVLKGEKLVLAQLSPITNIVAEADDQDDTTTDLPGFAAVSDDANQAWFYFLRKPSSAAPAVLKETYINYGDVKTRTIGDLADTQQPSEKSKLAALYADGKTQVFYQRQQDGDNQLYYLTVGIHTGPQAIDGTGMALDGTPIAVTRTKTGVVYLYWMGTNGDLQRATRTDNKWQVTTGIMTVFKVNKLLKESQLTVAHTDLHGELRNHVTYIEKNDSEYLPHIDILS